MNKKVLNTKRALRDALCLLMQSQNVQDVTVSQLCREADIDRTTFYKYYSLPSDILNEYVDEIYLQAMEGVSLVKDRLTADEIYSFLLRQCYMYYENSNLMGCYMECNGMNLPNLQRLFVKEAKDLIPEDIDVYFVSGGVNAIITQWLLSDFDTTPESIAQRLTDLILRVIG